MAAIAAVYGCGGGGGASTGSGDPGGIPATSGFLTVRASGNGPGTPVIMGSKNAVVTGFAGAAYSTATVTLPPFQNLPPTDQSRARKLLYSAGGVIWMYDFANFRHVNLNGETASWSNTDVFSMAKSGTRIAYTKQIGSQKVLVTADPDGTNETQWAAITMTSMNLSADGKRIYYTVSNEDRILLRSAPGGSYTTLPQVTYGTTNRILDVSPDGTRILVQSFRSSDSTYALQQVYTGSSTIETLYSGGTEFIRGASYSADGRVVAYVLRFIGEPAIAIRDARPGASGDILYSHALAQGDFDDIDFQPDRRTLVVSRFENGRRIFEALDTLNPDSLSSITSIDSLPFTSLAMAPYIDYRTLIGGSSGIFSACSAMLYTQVGSSFGSFLAIDATNRSASTVISQDDPNDEQSVIVATLVAGASNKFLGIRYINDLTDGVNTGGNLNNFDGAVVTVDSTTGDIIAVLPYNGSKSSQRIVREGDSVRLQGEFLGVFDARGKNLADSGANEVLVSTDGVKVTR